MFALTQGFDELSDVDDALANENSNPTVAADRLSSSPSPPPLSLRPVPVNSSPDWEALLCPQQPPRQSSPVLTPTQLATPTQQAPSPSLVANPPSLKRPLDSTGPEPAPNRSPPSETRPN